MTSSHWWPCTLPGPMAFIPEYARNKNNPAGIAYEDERLEPIPSSTYGVAIYQEQLMEISKRIMGFHSGAGRRPA